MLVSVVIITKNEGHIIANTLQSLSGVTDDIIIVDSGSTDDTLTIAKQFNSNIVETAWNGYGINKNLGCNEAKHDWILGLDADEVIDKVLNQSLQQFSCQKNNVVFKIRYKNFFCGKVIRFGEWGSDRHIRLFNRKVVKWNNAEVHESLVSTEALSVQMMKGNILHYTVDKREEFNEKINTYSRLNAKRYFATGKKTSLLRIYIAPLVSFLQNYVFRMGFLDGKEGFIIAMGKTRYVYLKYKYLDQLHKSK